MARRIVVLVVVLVVVVVFYLGYTNYDAKRAGASGDVYTESSSGKTKDSKAPASSDTEKTPEPATDPQAVVYPPAAEQSTRTPAASTASDMASVPSSGDTISPNPPNGEVFAGKGKYQLYRQGNLTWRLDTDTGQSCVIFATDEEWKKPKVYRAGCGRR